MKYQELIEDANNVSSPLGMERQRKILKLRVVLDGSSGSAEIDRDCAENGIERHGISLCRWTYAAIMINNATPTGAQRLVPG